MLATEAPSASAAIIEQIGNQRRAVDFDTYDISVQQLIAMVENSQIDVAPAYQRQFRWDTTRRSQLVESVLLGVPVPSLFMATNRDGTWELVDGVQRLSSLVQFAGSNEARERLSISHPLILENLEKLSRVNGLTFAELPHSVRLQFGLRPVKVITLSDKSDPIVRFDLFQRLNTGGIALTDQDIRACIYRGPFNDFLARVAQSKDFTQVVRLTDKQKSDGTREECALRFFAYLHRYEKFEHSVVGFLNDYMKAAGVQFEYDDGQKIFDRTFAYLAQHLPSGIVRRETGRKQTPINLFEAVSVGAALALLRTSNPPGGKHVAEWIDSEELRKFTTGATNSLQAVKGRIEYCRKRFLGK